MSHARELAFAAEAVSRACALCRAVQASMVPRDSLAKADRSPVTVADFAVQAVISHALAEAFPHDGLVGEEHSADLHADDRIRSQVVQAVRTVRPELGEAGILGAIDRGGHPGGPAGRFWALDPIDGTRGFLQRRQYAVALALIEEGQPVVGALGCPDLPVEQGAADGPPGCLFTAARGLGARMRVLGGGEILIRTADVSDPSLASFCESVESGHSAHGQAARIAALLGVTAPPCRIDSQCKYAVVARGDASIYLRLPTREDYREKIWDHAAGWIVIREAGGQVTDVTGRPLDFSLGRTLQANRGVVATNGRLHEAVLAAVRQVLGEAGRQST